MNRETGFPGPPARRASGPDMDRNLSLRGLDEGGDQRYWRRQANRRVRKARFTRNFARWSLILGLHLAFGSLVLYTGHRVWRQVSGSDEFSLKHLEIDGATRTKSAAIERALAPYLGSAVLDLNLTEIARAVERDPWVLSASLKRVLPDTLRIEVEERTPCAIAIIGGLAHVVDSRGFVIGPAGPHPTDDLPVLTGLSGPREPAGGRNAGHARLAGELLRGVRAIERLRRASPAFMNEISALDLSRSDRITLRTVQPGPLVLLDPERVDRNVLRFLSLRPAVEERVGAAAFVDLRWEDRVSVMPLPRLPASAG